MDFLDNTTTTSFTKMRVGELLLAFQTKDDSVLLRLTKLSSTNAPCPIHFVKVIA
jgi:hypothetical protein